MFVSILGLCYVYGTMVYFAKSYYKDNTNYFQIMNKPNINLLQTQIGSFYLNNSRINSTQHYYVIQTPDHIRHSIEIIKKEVVNYLGAETYQNIENIDEIYFTAKTTQNSDLSFTNLHSDSPFHFCHTLRVLVCINPNMNVVTYIPEYNFNVTLKTYDVLSFDYANTLHYISIRDVGTRSYETRVVLKLHFAKNWFCKILTRRYTHWARNLYVHNLRFLNQWGYIMLLTQFMSAYMGYVLIFFYTILVLYCSHKHLRPVLTPFLYSYMTLTMYYVGFQIYFILYEQNM